MALASARFKHDPRFLSMASGVVPMKVKTPLEAGPAVRIIQRALIDLMHVTLPNSTGVGEGVPDGFYGEETAEAVKLFQRSQSLSDDGSIGKNTMAALDLAFAMDSDEISPGMGGPVPDAWHNAFWRTLDNRTSFQADAALRTDVMACQNATNVFREVVKGRQPQGAWDTAVFTLNAAGTITRVSAVQSGVVYDRLGKPAPLLTLLDAIEEFGQNALPIDPAHLGPGQKHNMDGGQFRWGDWTAFADAAIKSGIERNFWFAMRRGILAGFWFDGLRVGFPVQTPVGSSPSAAQIQNLIRTQADSQIEQQLRAQCAASLP